MRFAACGLAAVLAVGPAVGHGASEGLHVHVRPDPSARGSEIRVRVEAAEPLVVLRVGVGNGRPLEVTPKRPDRRIEVRLRVPEETAGPTASVQAEARTASGKTVRASAIVGLSEPGSRPAPGSAPPLR